MSGVAGLGVRDTVREDAVGHGAGRRGGLRDDGVRDDGGGHDDAQADGAQHDHAQHDDAGHDDPLVHAVRAALARLRDPRRLTDGALLGVPGLGSPPAVAAFVRAEIAALTASPSPIDREAGQILRLYYLGRSSGHDVTAHRLHLSRATYFRRLDYGIRHLAEAARTLAFAEG